jgi:hypothetical protein
MSKTLVLLGRAGDILGILPMLYADAQRGERRKLVIAEEFASIGEGCSYFDTVPFAGPHYDIAKACNEAKAVNGEVQCLQIKGPRQEVEEWTWKPAGVSANMTPSFEQEPWRMAGRLNEWGKYPLVFDKRNPEREAALLDKVLPPKRGRKKPVMLVSTSGTSSPFPYKELLHELLALKFGKPYNIVDLDGVQAERFYDILALYERANILISTDSAPLHLARAVPGLPVVALTNDKPNLWVGTAWMPSHIWYCRYGDFCDRATKMLEAIEGIKKILVSGPLVVHVWNAYEFKRTIDYGLRWLPLPIWKGSCGRDSGNTISDERRFPYLKDVLRMALKAGLLDGTEGEFVLLTRPETGIVDHTPKEITLHEACYAYRIEDGVFKPIIDMLCATRAFWKTVLKEIPDMVLGKDFWWSQALWSIFRKHGAVDVTGCVYRVKKA